MPYTPPVGTVDLNLAGSYTPPVGTVDLNLAPPGVARNVWIAAVTGGARVSARAGVPVRCWGAAVTGGARGIASIAYDPNLLSAVHAVQAAQWQPGAAPRPGATAHWQTARRLWRSGPAVWQAASSLPDATVSAWAPSARLNAPGAATWQAARGVNAGKMNGWHTAPRLERHRADRWQAADPQRTTTLTRFHVRLPLYTAHPTAIWQAGTAVTRSVRDWANDGLRLVAVEIEGWQRAGYPANAANPDKDALPALIPTPWGTALKIVCPLPGTALRIGRVPCVLIAENEIAVRRSYMSVNSASLVRWPDLTPLPCTSMTMETDFESWCWSLSATLAGPDAWALVQPNPLACEVLATINGQAWKFLLDVPSTNRAFNRDQVTLKGRSRSAWLHAPYTPARDFSEANAREMQQLGEAALDNTGWLLAWLGESWVVPAGRAVYWDTPIGALIRLAQATDDGLYTDPTLQVITLHKRWPAASWLVDGAVADLSIPEAAILTLTQSPLYSLPYNGVYVSGTTHGALALVKIAGTDGALQPADPFVHDLLCDPEGVAARQRGLNALSDAGAGFTLDAETLFNPPTFPLVPPGLIVSLAGMKGVARSVRISAQWSGDSGLQVKQSIGLERREVES